MTTHVYSQSTGHWTLPDGHLLGVGYAGNGPGLNNPAMENVPMHGPLPRGLYTIGKPYDNPHTGHYTMNLDPASTNQMFGRGLFRCHGDNPAMDHSASDGCIILGPALREAIAASDNNQLEVVA